MNAPNPVPADSLAALLSQPSFLAEVHHLLWIKPFVNHGVLDYGWSCRDHAMTLGLVASMLGNEVILVTGQATFVQGASGGRSPRGIEMNPHTWFRAEGSGSYDASWRLDSIRNMPQWRAWNTHGVFASKVAPGAAASYFLTSYPGKYGNVVNGSTHLADTRSATYLAERIEPLTPELIEHQYTWVNSPLTDRIMPSGKALYAAAALHLLARLEGSTDDLSPLDSNEAWRTLAIRFPDPLTTVAERYGKVHDSDG